MSQKTILITGCNSGIGLKTAHLFLSKNFSVIGLDISSNAENSLNAHIDNFRYFKCDVSKHEEFKAVFDQLGEDFKLNCLVNNAGILGPRKKVVDYPEDIFAKVIDVNLKGVYYGMKYAIPLLLKAENPSIVNVASVAGHVGMAAHLAYSASKHAVVGMTKTSAVEYAKAGLRINAICPGFTSTAMVKEAQVDADYLNALIYATPMRRLGTPEEIAKAIYYLAEEASFVTGQSLIIDGGLSSQ